MRVDLYRRSEYDSKFSYVAVPEGRPLPEEVTGVDWEADGTGIQWDEGADLLASHGIEDHAQQIAEKGYAITGVKHLVTVSS